MQTTSTTLFASVAAALLTLASTGHAQSMSGGRTFSKTYGNTIAGVYSGGGGSFAAVKSTQYVPSTGSGWIVTAPYWHTKLAASGNAHAFADIRLLGNWARAGEFRISLAAESNTKKDNLGRTMSTTCKSSGVVYLRVGNSVLWNSSVNTMFSGISSMRLQIMTSSMVVALGGSASQLTARAYGRVRAAIYVNIDPCKAKVRLNGEAAVSGDTTATTAAIGLMKPVSVTFSFSIKEQKLDANGTTAQPGLNATTTWGRAGNLIFHRGAMGSTINAYAIQPTSIPVSSTLAYWSFPYAWTLLF